MRRHLAACALGAALLATVAGPASAASTDPKDGGFWYLTATGVDELHQRTTGEGITIAVLDDPVNPDASDLVGTDLTIKQPSYCATEPSGPAVPAPTGSALARHGTSMASLLIGTGAGQGPDGRSGVRGVAPGASVISYTIRSVSETSDCLNPGGVGAPGDAAFRDAVADGADIINVSGTLLLSDTAYVEALQAGVIVVAAAGNEGGPLAGAPATMNGAVAVGTVTVDRELDPGSPVGPELGVVAPGTDIRCTDETYTTYLLCTGSSDAAAYTSGVLALAWSLHPDATANQILQAMVHTTDGEVRETPVRDDAWGYGTVNARLLMDADPTSYPDVSPFVRDDPQADPPASMLVAQAPTEPEEPADEGAANEAGTDDGEPATGTSTTLLAIGAVAALAVVGVVVVIAVAARRRAGATAAGTDRDRTFQPTHDGGHHG